jgi:arylsulfatase A-like enzyme
MNGTLNRRTFLKTVGLSAAALAAARWLHAADATLRSSASLRNTSATLRSSASLRSTRPPAGPKPNIIFILADDLGFGDPQCDNPASKIPTPNIDRLATQGVRFSDAHSGSAVCTPTRYGILTGRYCWRSSLKRGVLGGFSPPLIEKGRLTVPALLKQHGYATACLGKWHLGMDWPGSDGKPDNGAGIDFAKPIKNGPTTYGFDYYYGISASLDMPPYVFIENDRTVCLPTARQEKWDAVRAGPKAPDFKFEDVLPTLTKKAVDYISAQTPGKPFFLYLPLNAPHTPVVPSDFVKGKSQAGEYGDFVYEVDWTLGEVMKALDEKNLAESTLLILTSDNGSTLLELKEYGHRPNAPYRGRKSDIWDGGHREPFIARWPGKIKPGTVCDETIWLGDLMGTCAALVGAVLPPDAGEDSYNILPALTGEPHARPIRPGVVHHSIDGMFAIREGKWKLVLGRGSGGWDGKGSPSDPEGQLYDMEKDSAEAENLYVKHPEIVQRLAALLEKYKTDGRSRPK